MGSKSKFENIFRLRNDLQVEAVDGDKSGTRNSHISYEIINGNYDKKFSIDKNTGTIIFGLKRSNGSTNIRILVQDLDPLSQVRLILFIFVTKSNSLLSVENSI